MKKFTYICANCEKRKFFSEYVESRNPNKHDRENKFLKYCLKCDEILKEKEEKRLKNLKLSKKKKQEEKKKEQAEADKKFLDEIKKEVENRSSKPKKSANKVSEDSEESEPSIEAEKSKTKQEDVSLERQAEELAKTTDSVLYIYVDVKRIKVIEWIFFKKRIALNKEREIRKTHKGGWSQEKFQRFVKGKKAKTLEWVEENLTRKGVLRGPYDEVVLNIDDENYKSFVEDLVNNKT